MSSSKDYFPKDESRRQAWFGTYKTQIAIDGPTVGVEGTELSAQQALCTAAITAYADVQTKMNAYNGAVAFKNEKVTEAMDALRPDIKRIKTNAAYNAGIGERLGIVGSTDEPDPADYVAKITAEVRGGFVRIKFVKGIADGINLYHRLKGSGTWAFLARDTKSPYDDHIEIPAGGAPQHWEYQAYGVKDDAQFGLASDIVEATIG